MFFFYMNKDFHSQMNFNLNISNYNSIRKRIETKKIDDIINRMQKLLKFDQKYIKKIKSIMRKQINKHRKKIKYQIDDFVKLSSKNIKIIKLSKKLNDRMLNSFKIIEKMNILYRLKLFSSMHQHDVLLFNYLKFVVNDSLLLRATGKIESNNKIDNSIRFKIELSRIQFALKSNCSRIESSKTRMKNYRIQHNIYFKFIEFYNNLYNNRSLNQCC